MKKNINKVFEKLPLVVLILFSFVFLFVAIKINIFRYNNFDYGKFDLGNMSQMMWNTLDGRFMYLTDYFGTNLPRWAMSHVDPIILLTLPFFAVFSHPMTLVYFQLILVTFSSILIYLIGYLKLQSRIAGSLFGLAFLAYPSVGFISAWTGFHGVSVAIPFFLAAFYLFEHMYKNKRFNKTNVVWFWILLIITMSGKEQLPIYVFLFGVFILLFRNEDIQNLTLSKSNLKKIMNTTSSKIGIKMMLVSVVWASAAFLLIIPFYAEKRVEGYRRFSRSLGIEDANTRDVALPNYFLSRYDAFGNSYKNIVAGVITNPDLTVRVIFGGDRIENLIKTFGPLMYVPFVYPQLTLIAVPDLLINYLTSAGGIGTAEIRNHRISMIIPVLFLATIYAIGFISKILRKVKLIKLSEKHIAGCFALILFISNLYMSFYTNNPVYLWITQAIRKRVFAKTNTDIANNELLKIGDVIKISELENKDRECAKRVVEMIPEKVSVSGPDYLGAHLSMRETYAIFPALYNEADYVITDIFSKKILTILDVDTDLIHDIVKKVIKDEDYTLTYGCGNLFVFQKVGPHNKSQKLPLQERYNYPVKTDFELLRSLFVVDYFVPDSFTREEPKGVKFVYQKKENDSLDSFTMFVTLVNENTGKIYQTANLPSFGLKQPENWIEGRYYIEEYDLSLPKFLDNGTYKFFVGMGNNVKTRSMFLGRVKVL